ncbi:uncharacterized protein [Lepeophtheirus salmonis]|uniref:uncharacterized protein n=1 Tax=Lepeophtheirus salmonis TaxID=72036 RepID=UPI001AEA063D|nr:uncharacterized protein LOC121116409 [Lepeophtheirus salmonis]
MSDSICNAHFIGRKVVEGPLHDRALSVIVSELMNCKTREGGDQPCHLEWTDCCLLIHYIKKDEGFFESDGESVRSQDEKPSIVKRSFSEGEESDTSSANSSGTDSSDETHRNTPSHSPETKACPTFDLKESYPLNDVLICHADKDYRKCVIWIVRKGPQLDALVFQCASEGRVRDLYRQYQEGHRRSKLERQRNARKVGKRFTGSAESILEVNPKSSVHRHSANADTICKWNLIHHTDSDGVTHIEVETSNKSDKSKFTRELESILSKELKFRSPKSGEGKPPKKYDHHLSLRQRAPALLLRKFDEMEEKAYRSWSKTEEEQNRKIWSKGPSRHPKRPEICTGICQCCNSHNNNNANNSNNKQILVPTKTGSEPVKKLYPKDQAPSTERILRNIPTRYLTITPNPIQFASTQPHSLPIYHVGHIAWAARYPPIVDYPESVWTTSVPRGSSSSLIGNRGRSRDRNSRDTLPEPSRRRAQSKSPARSEGNNISRRFREFGDAVKSRMSRKSTQNPIPSSDPSTHHHLKSNLKKPSDLSSSPVSMDSSFSSSQGIFGQGGEEFRGHSISSSSDKKVHFNKFATVQMME